MQYFFTFILISTLFFGCQPTDTQIEKTAKATTSPKPKVLEVDTSIFETFSFQEGDTTFLMKKYYMVHLKTGPKRDHSEDETAKIQKAHLAHLSQLADDQKICIAGPFEGDPEIRGIAIYSVPSLEIADSLASADPAVQAGRLTVEVIPFWGAVGSQLF